MPPSVQDPLARLLRWCSVQPDHPAVVEDARTVPYGEFGQKVRRIAAAIADSTASGDSRVLIHLAQGSDAYAAMFGALMAGGYYAPVDVTAPPERQTRIVAGFEPTVVVTATSLPPHVAAAAGQAKVVDLSKLPATELAEPRAPAHLAYVIFTSGSTGEPKGVMIPRRGLAHYTAWAGEAMAIVPGDRWSQHPNIAFDLSVLDIYGALCWGATLYPITNRKDRLMPGDFVRRHRLTIWDSVPSVIDLMRRAGQAGAEQLSSLRMATFCGEPLLAEHLDALFAANPGLTVHNTYGPTEATVSCTLVRLSAANYRSACGSSVALGSAIPGMRLDLVGGESGEEGEIVLSGPQLADGYWRQPERTSSTFVEIDLGGRPTRVYRTGDWARYSEGHLYFVSRTDRQVKIHGHRLELGEVEAALRAAGAVLARGEVHAFVEGVGGETLPDLHAKLVRRLPSYAIPAQIHVVERFPRNANDKVDAAALAKTLDVASIGANG